MTKVRWNIMIDPKIKSEIKIIAIKGGLTESQLVEKALAKYLEPK